MLAALLFSKAPHQIGKPTSYIWGVEAYRVLISMPLPLRHLAGSKYGKCIFPFRFLLNNRFFGKFSKQISVFGQERRSTPYIFQCNLHKLLHHNNIINATCIYNWLMKTPHFSIILPFIGLSGGWLQCNRKLILFVLENESEAQDRKKDLIKLSWEGWLVAPTITWAISKSARRKYRSPCSLRYLVFWIKIWTTSFWIPRSLSVIVLLIRRLLTSLTVVVLRHWLPWAEW